jgi:rhodanese-related sulfurtransferase
MDIPEISPRDLSAKLKSDAQFVLLDVREPWELSYARLDDPRLVVLPLSRLARERAAALPETISTDPAAEVVVLCHHGVRSADVTAWLIQEGWKNARSLAGGIDAYAREIDSSVGSY